MLCVGMAAALASKQSHAIFAESERECARQGSGSRSALAGAQADVITCNAQIFLAARRWGAFSRPCMPTAGDETRQKALSQNGSNDDRLYLRLY